MIKAAIRFVLVTVLLVTGLTAQAEFLTDAKDLINAGKYKEAFNLLEPLEPEHAGEIDFDYMLGVSALETGNLTRSIFALERVLAVNPNKLDARALIAKAYFLSGETENAKAEYENVRKQDANNQYSKVIEGNLDAIDKAMGKTAVYSAFIDLGLGHDSNINSATDRMGVVVPNLGFVQLSNNSIEQSSNFASLATGISFKAPFFNKDWNVFGGVSANLKENNRNDLFDIGAYDLNLGVSYKRFVDTFSLALQGNSFSVDDQQFRRSLGLNAQWVRAIDDRNQLSVFANGSYLEYPNDKIRDADRYVIGAGWGHAFEGDKTPLLFLNGYLGKENADESDLSNQLFGVRLGGQLSFNYKLVAYAGAGYEKRDYDGPIGGFITDREDNQYDLTVGLRYLPYKTWMIKPQLSYIENKSNTDLLDFDRTMISINVRKSFDW